LVAEWALIKAALHQFQGHYWFRFLSPMRKKWLWVFKNITQLTVGSRTIFLIVIGLNWADKRRI
jgi:hypothetical protein